MTKHFRSEILVLNQKVMHLTAMVEENLKLAVQSVISRDPDMAKSVVLRDEEIDRLEVELEEDCLKILALHQPVAIDLRFIVAAMKINSDLERIGDLAVNIAELTPELAGADIRVVPFDLDAMLSLALEMVQKSADALVEMSPEMALAVCKMDDKLDELYHEANEIIVKKIMADNSNTSYFIGLRDIARHLERIGDHSTNIAEDVIYMVNGEIVRHRGPDMTI